LEIENEAFIEKLRDITGNPKINIKNINSIQGELSAQLIHNMLMNGNFLSIYPQLSKLAERIVSY